MKFSKLRVISNTVDNLGKVYGEIEYKAHVVYSAWY